MKRQYVGCAGPVENAINVICASYGVPAGHALAAAHLYLPAECRTRLTLRLASRTGS